MAKSLDKSDGKKDRTERTDKEGRDGGTATAEKTRPNQPPSHAPVAQTTAHPRDPARDSALSRAVQQIEKQFGKGSVMKMDGDPQPIEGIPTGSLSLDIALGGAGIPRGRVIEVFGPESSGKTTLTLHLIANTQRAGG